MGSRANYVVVEGGDWTLHRSHWGAGRVATDLAHGPAAATRCFRANSRVDDALRTDPDGWLDDVWCEGAALVDHDRRMLLWYCDEWDGWARYAAQRAVLARTWPGWEIRWASDGLGDLHDHLGLGRGFTRRDAEPQEAGAPFWERPDEDDTRTLLTVRRPDGRVRAWGSPLEVVDQLGGGEALLGLLPDDASVPGLATMPDSGIHLDQLTRTIGVWTTVPMVGLRSWPLPGWAGWELCLWGDDHTRQAAASDDVVHLPEVDLTAELRRWLERVGEPPLDSWPRILQALAPPPGSELTAVVNPSAAVPHAGPEPTGAERVALRAAFAAVLAEQPGAGG
ncbi:hypothetical protein OG689_14090 [Kitasatospora sp. NBC_00240]|uniref:hypothetical protein n=1 Tax=Kitasatospora sp. NBC_00240 TaxID=2903567 RepID=UPI00224ED724|nr:hypothetical protein [Kitasatospora sp. NBC_00240]MCX5210407.1 hypothetical protein [Kitasatospora sp. NBC_00240]